MGLWKIIVPETSDVTNLVINPSSETGATGYAHAGAATLDSLLVKARRGFAGEQSVLTTGTGDGIYYGTVSLTSGITYTASIDVYGVAGVPMKLYFATTAGAAKGTATTWTGSGGWSRQSVTWTCDSTTTYRIYVIKNNDATAGTLFVDGLLCWAGDHEIKYFDGDTDGAYWIGVPARIGFRHASWSQSPHRCIR